MAQISAAVAGDSPARSAETAAVKETLSTAPEASTFWNREALTGDWFGLRPALKDLHLTADLQWIARARGALDEAWIGGLRANITF